VLNSVKDESELTDALGAVEIDRRVEKMT